MERRLPLPCASGGQGKEIDAIVFRCGAAGRLSVVDERLSPQGSRSIHKQSAGVILDFCNGRVGCVADIKKFHNQVHLFPEDVHMQRFLWRNLNPDVPPQTQAIAVNNFGVPIASLLVPFDALLTNLHLSSREQGGLNSDVHR